MPVGATAFSGWLVGRVAVSPELPAPLFGGRTTRGGTHARGTYALDRPRRAGGDGSAPAAAGLAPRGPIPRGGLRRLRRRLDRYAQLPAFRARPRVGPPPVAAPPAVTVRPATMSASAVAGGRRLSARRCHTAAAGGE